VAGSDAEKREAFHCIFHEIRNRLQLFVSLPVEKLDRAALQHEVRALATP
jgi:arsenate reductase